MDSLIDELLYIEVIESDPNQESNSEDIENTITHDLEAHIDDDKCVICLDNLESNDITKIFPCTHNKYMHNKCTKNITKCPICRVNSKNVNQSLIIINNNEDRCFPIFVGFILLTVCGIFIAVLASPFYYSEYFGTYKYNNYTSTGNSTHV